MAKTTYRKKTSRARRNPTLLTLVNPSKAPKKKAAKKKTPAELRKQKKKVSPKQRAATQQALRGVAPVRGATKRPAARKVGGRSYVGGTKGLRSGQSPKKPAFKGRKGDVVPARRAGPGSQKYQTRGGRSARRSKPTAGWNWVTEHDRGQVEDGVSSYWRYQQNEGEDMYGRRKIRRRRRNTSAARRGRGGRFVKRATPKRIRRNSPKRKAAPKRKAPAKRKGMTAAKRSAAAKKAARTRAANKRKRSAAAKKAAATRKRGGRKTTRKSTKSKARRNRRVVRSKGKRYYTRNKPVRRRRKRNYARKNPIPQLAKEIAVGFGGFLAGRLTANMLTRAEFIPENIRPYSGLLGTALGVGLAYYVPKKVKALKPYQSGLLLGTGIAMADVLFSSFAPENVRAYVGAPQPVVLPGMGQDLSVYEAALRGWGGPPVWLDEAGDWGQKPLLPGRGYPVTSAMGLDVQEALAEYIEEPLAEYIEEPLAEYIEEPLGMDEDGALVSDDDDLDAGVVNDSLFGSDEIDIMALDDVPFEGDRSAGKAAAVAAQVANAGARAGRPVKEIVAASNNAACQAMGTARLSAMVKKIVAAEVAKAVGRVQSFVPRQDPASGAPMAVGPIRAAKPVKWSYGSINESGGIFAKGPFG